MLRRSLLLVLAAGIAAGGTVFAMARPERLNAGGSTFVFPMMSKWAKEYEAARGVQVNYQSIGSGGGIQKMTAKEFDFGCSDAPLNDEQTKKALAAGGDIVHIPLCMGAVVPAYNLPGVGKLTLSGPVLADIFMAKITKWNDPKIAALNPGANLPTQNIVVVHRSDGSGTTFVFADYLAKVSDAWKTQIGVSTSLKWPRDTVGAKGSEGVSGQVKLNPGAITYVELTYALQNGIAFAAVQNQAGEPILASLESVSAAAANSLAQIPDDLKYSITNAPGKGSYPIAGTVWAVAYVKSPSGHGAQVADFLKWATGPEGQKLTTDLKYAPLPEGLIQRIQKKLDQLK